MNAGTDAAPPGTVRSARLDLVSIGPEIAEAVLTGREQVALERIGALGPLDWAEPVRRMLEMRVGQMRRDPSEQEWLARAMVLREPERWIVGTLGFHGRPDADGAVEIGYSVRPEHRRQGYAQEAVETLFDWAGREHGITRFRASVSPDNEPSLNLVRKLGFVQIGDQWDEEDGLELVFEVTRPIPS